MSHHRDSVQLSALSAVPPLVLLHRLFWTETKLGAVIVGDEETRREDGGAAIGDGCMPETVIGALETLLLVFGGGRIAVG